MEKVRGDRLATPISFWTNEKGWRVKDLTPTFMALSQSKT
jgi:hypothetical protein